jgi:hypothetical protein
MLETAIQPFFLSLRTLLISFFFGPLEIACQHPLIGDIPWARVYIKGYVCDLIYNLLIPIFECHRAMLTLCDVFPMYMHNEKV